jgi:hypothetical protein
MLEGFKLAGAIVAFVTALFTVWDRWARGRPLAWVTARERWGNPEDYICIKNPGHSDVFIREVRVYPQAARKLYGVAKGHSAKSILSSLRDEVNVLLRSGDEEYLPIIPLLDEPTVTPPRWVCFLVYWRKTSSTWLPQVPVPVITSTHDIQRIAAAATRRAGVP